MALDRGEKLPVARADILLLHGAAMDGDRGDPALKGTIEDRPEPLGALLRVIDPAAHLEGDGDAGRHGIAHSGNDLEGRLRNAEEIAPATAAKHLFDRAAEVDVDDVVALGHEPAGRGGKVVGIRAHELRADRMLLGGEGEPGVVALAAVGRDDERIEEDFAEAIGRAVAPREDAHRPVAVAREGRLEDGRGKLHMADRGRREGPRW